jgi:enoyl-CoA hydratase
MSEPTILRRSEGPVSILTINRPEVLNALDIPTVRLIGDAVAAIGEDPSARVIVISGAGDRAFSAGGDIDEMATMAGLATDTVMGEWQRSLEVIARSPKPVIAAVNGYAYGGGTELAMACHIRVAAADASFGQPEIALDHVPGAGGTQRLPRLIPLTLAYEYLLTGDPIPAAEAHRIGLVSHVWPAAELMPKAIRLAQRIAERSPTAVRLTMEAVRDGLAGPLDTGLRLERALAALALESEEAKAGLQRFLARRKAKRR